MTYRILLVERDRLLRAALVRMLKPNVVVEVSEANDALRQVAMGRFDVALVAVRLWPLDGARLAADLQRVHGVPVLVTTGTAVSEIRELVEDLSLRNVVDVLAMPISQRALNRAIIRAAEETCPGERSMPT